MTKNELELLVRTTIERVLRGEQIEDDFIDLKLEWDLADPRRNARQIAALANAAGGQNVVWIVGADDKKGIVKTPPQIEPADWFPRLLSHFDQVHPEKIRYLLIPLDNGETVSATEFETDRAPYVVKVANGGQVSREVPFRKHTSVESATHSDLLRILVPKQRLPDVIPLSCNFAAGPQSGGYMPGASAILSVLIDSPSADTSFVISHEMVDCIVEIGDSVFMNWTEVGMYFGSNKASSNLSLLGSGVVIFKFLNDETVSSSFNSWKGHEQKAVLRLVFHLPQGKKQAAIDLTPISSPGEGTLHWGFRFRRDTGP